MEQHIDALVAQSIRRVRNVRRPAKQRSKGLLVGEGDSWFDYFSYDILRKLEHYGYDIRWVSHHGDTLHEMATLETQHDKLTSVLDRLNRRNRIPRGVLVSAGGNDLAEEGVLRSLLNDASWGTPILNDQAVMGFVNVKLRNDYVSLLRFITTLCAKIFGAELSISIVIHGYAHPVPDGRGVGLFDEPGPWLKPEFEAKGHDDLSKNTAAMEDLIDRFNGMLADLPEAAGLGHVQYVDVRGCLKNTLDDNRYERYWGSGAAVPGCRCRFGRGPPSARGIGAAAQCGRFAPSSSPHIHPARLLQVGVAFPRTSPPRGPAPCRADGTACSGDRTRPGSPGPQPIRRAPKPPGRGGEDLKRHSRGSRRAGVVRRASAWFSPNLVYGEKLSRCYIRSGWIGRRRFALSDRARVRPCAPMNARIRTTRSYNPPPSEPEAPPSHRPTTLRMPVERNRTCLELRCNIEAPASNKPHVMRRGHLSFRRSSKVG